MALAENTSVSIMDWDSSVKFNYSFRLDSVSSMTVGSLGNRN